MAEFDVSFPATSANLGPAFDTAALALDFHLRVQARRAEVFSLTAEGRDAAICGDLSQHLVVEVYRQTLEAAARPVTPLALHLTNQIPIGKGCGSSAAARLAGLALAVHFGSLDWTPQRIFEESARLEGHPDNVAACWWGGLAVAQSRADGGVNWLRIPVAEPWPLLIVVPAQALPTAEARRVLPAQYSRADAVANVQNAVLLLHAFQQGRPDLLPAAFEDRLHQPYRAALCPLLPALQPLVGSAGILGCALSGAGPSVLLVLRKVEHRATASAAVESALRQAAIEAEVLSAAIEPHGAAAALQALSQGKA